MIKYFHELTEQEFDKLVESQRDFGDIISDWLIMAHATDLRSAVRAAYEDAATIAEETGGHSGIVIGARILMKREAVCPNTEATKT